MVEGISLTRIGAKDFGTSGCTYLCKENIIFQVIVKDSKTMLSWYLHNRHAEA